MARTLGYCFLLLYELMQRVARAGPCRLKLDMTRGELDVVRPVSSGPGLHDQLGLTSLCMDAGRRRRTER